MFSNQTHALDGAIFPWLSDTCAFLLFYHFEIFSCILLISNLMIFLVQFGINKHLKIFKLPNCNFVSLWKIYLCLLIPNCTGNHVITYINNSILQYWLDYLPKSRPAFTLEKLFLRWSFKSLFSNKEMAKANTTTLYSFFQLHVKRSLPFEQPSSWFVVIINVTCFSRCLVGLWNSKPCLYSLLA